MSFALHADTLRQRNFWRKGEREADGRPLLDGGVQVKTDAARAHVADFSGFAVVGFFAPGDRYGNPEREASCSPFLFLGLCHALPQAIEVALNYAKDAVKGHLPSIPPL